MIVTELHQRLSELAEPSYCQFLKKLKVSDYRIFGVRSAHIHAISKQLAKNEGEKTFLSMLNSPTLSYEEILLLYRLFGLIDLSVEQRLAYLERLLTYNHSWATNDTLASALRCINDDKDLYYTYLSSLLKRKDPYDIRLGVVTLMLYYLDSLYIDDVLQSLRDVPSDHYYVMMALGWAYATAYCKDAQKVVPYLDKSNNLLDERVRKKAIQKIVESKLVSDSEKRTIKALR